MGRPIFAPKSTPFQWPIPNLVTCLIQWTRPTYRAKRHPDLISRFFHNALDRQTDRHRLTVCRASIALRGKNDVSRTKRDGWFSEYAQVEPDLSRLLEVEEKEEHNTVHSADYHSICTLCASTRALNHLLPHGAVWPFHTLKDIPVTYLPEYSTYVLKRAFVTRCLYRFVK